ncbi:MAG TPA: hypothetical protein VEY30_03790 [Myxococcaceae bacterium]|nr:hypothetical protein [Myxococcaceae bacterium]
MEEAANGVEALLKLREAPPSLAVMDYDLGAPPNGLEVVASLRARAQLQHLPVVLVTGSPIRCAVSVQVVLYKPVDPGAVLDMVRSLLSTGGNTR